MMLPQVQTTARPRPEVESVAYPGDAKNLMGRMLMLERCAKNELGFAVEAPARPLKNRNSASLTMPVPAHGLLSPTLRPKPALTQMREAEQYAKRPGAVTERMFAGENGAVLLTRQVLFVIIALEQRYFVRQTLPAPGISRLRVMSARNAQAK